MMQIRNDSIVFKFCRSKCNKAFKRKWHPIKTRWTKQYRQFHKKENFTENKSPSEILQYNRELFAKTLDLMPTISFVESQKRKAEIHKRIMEIREKNKKIDMNILKKHGHLLEKEEKKEQKLPDAAQQSTINN